MECLQLEQSETRRNLLLASPEQYASVGETADIANGVSMGVTSYLIIMFTGSYSTVTLTYLFYLFFYLPINYPINLQLVYLNSKRPKEFNSKKMDFLAMRESKEAVAALPGRYSYFTNYAWNALYPFLVEWGLIMLFSIVLYFLKKKKKQWFEREGLFPKLLNLLHTHLVWNMVYSLLLPAISIYFFSIAICLKWAPADSFEGWVSIALSGLIAYLFLRTIFLSFYIPFKIRNSNSNLQEIPQLALVRSLSEDKNIKATLPTTTKQVETLFEYTKSLGLKPAYDHNSSSNIPKFLLLFPEFGNVELIKQNYTIFYENLKLRSNFGHLYISFDLIFASLFPLIMVF